MFEATKLVKNQSFISSLLGREGSEKEYFLYGSNFEKIDNP